LLIQSIISTLSWLYHTYMARRSSKSIAKILTTANVPLQDKNGSSNDNNNIHLALLENHSSN
jgi:hypothetical protein